MSRARMGGWPSTPLCIYRFPHLNFPSKKSSLQKIFGLNLSIHAREARGTPIPPYAALRAARISLGGDSLTLKLEPLLYSVLVLLIEATLAQLVEHVFRKDGVRSSILRGGSA